MFKECLNKLEGSSEFKAWKKDNKDCYLAHFFIMEENDPQLGYYDPKTEMLTVFSLKDNIKIAASEKVFKKEEDEVLKLDTDDISIDYASAVTVAKNLISKEYKNETIKKFIAILQKLKEFGNVWNITGVASSFNTLNIKIDAKTGKILKHSNISLIEKAE